MTTIRNSVQLIGHLGSDPEVRQTSNGNKVAKVSIATDRTYKRKDGQIIKETQWHRLTAWGNQAEYMEKYLSKGNLVGVLGRLKYDSVKSEDGSVRNYTDVVVSEIRNFSFKDIQF